MIFKCIIRAASASHVKLQQCQTLCREVTESRHFWHLSMGYAHHMKNGWALCVGEEVHTVHAWLGSHMLGLAPIL